MRMKGMSSHFRRRKDPAAKRLYDNTVAVSPVDVKKLKKVLPYW